jgi:hypothetical protein
MGSMMIKRVMRHSVGEEEREKHEPELQLSFTELNDA